MAKSCYELLLKGNLFESFSLYYVLLYDNEELLICLVDKSVTPYKRAFNVGSHI